MRPEKKLMLQEMEERFGAARALVLADYSGLDVETFDALRLALEEGAGKVMVVKNRLLKRMLKEIRRAPADMSLEGPTAVAYADDPVALSKIVTAFSKKNAGPSVKVGFLENRVLLESEIKAIAQLPPRDVLVAQAVGAIGAPLRGFVGVLHGRVQSLMTVLKQIVEKKQAG